MVKNADEMKITEYEDYSYSILTGVNKVNDMYAVKLFFKSMKIEFITVTEKESDGIEFFQHNLEVFKKIASSIEDVKTVVELEMGNETHRFTRFGFAQLKLGFKYLLIGVIFSLLMTSTSNFDLRYVAFYVSRISYGFAILCGVFGLVSEFIRNSTFKAKHTFIIAKDEDANVIIVDAKDLKEEGK